MKFLLSVYVICWGIVGFAQQDDCPAECEVYVPNTVTPDCDGVDCHFLTIQSNCEFKKFHFTFYNQYGEVVFESEDTEDRFSSKEVEEGTYVWRLEYTDCNRQKVKRHGYVNVLK